MIEYEITITVALVYYVYMKGSCLLRFDYEMEISVENTSLSSQILQALPAAERNKKLE